MEDLKTMLNEYSIERVNQNIKQFFQSAEGYPDKLKLAFVMVNLLEEGTNLLSSIEYTLFNNI